MLSDYMLEKMSVGGSLIIPRYRLLIIRCQAGIRFGGRPPVPHELCPHCPYDCANGELPKRSTSCK